jgi:hypothetical protein
MRLSAPLRPLCLRSDYVHATICSAPTTLSSDYVLHETICSAPTILYSDTTVNRHYITTDYLLLQPTLSVETTDFYLLYLLRSILYN